MTTVLTLEEAAEFLKVHPSTRLAEVEAELRKLRRIARMPPEDQGSKHKADPQEKP
jgi:hypothetical protein